MLILFLSGLRQTKRESISNSVNDRKNSEADPKN